MIVKVAPRKFELRSKTTGRVLGTHPSYEKALRQERAVQASKARARARKNPSRKSLTSVIRSAVKNVEPDARVSLDRGSSGGEESWTVRTKYKLDEVRLAIADLGLREWSDLDIEGSQWDWTYVLHVTRR